MSHPIGMLSSLPALPLLPYTRWSGYLVHTRTHTHTTLTSPSMEFNSAWFRVWNTQMYIVHLITGRITLYTSVAVFVNIHEWRHLT